MLNPLRAVQLLLFTSIMVSGMAAAADPASATEKDPLRATLMDERYVIGRSQQASRIVVRIDRIDSVSAAF